MPLRRKPQPATNSSAENRSSVTPSWKGWVIGFLFAFIVLGAIWSTGVFKQLFAGPKIPLPRQVGDVALGMTMDELAQKYPVIKKKLRLFNNDPQFKIVTLDASEGVTASTTLDLLFYIPNGKLYFVSAMWDSNSAKGVPVEDLAHQYRRWKQDSNGSPEPLGNNVVLKEWHFDDAQTEMILRDLDYSDHLQRWQDLRDDSNDAAQQAFSKYRLEAGG